MKVVSVCVQSLVCWKAIEGIIASISRENPWILSIQSLEAHHRCSTQPIQTHPTETPIKTIHDAIHTYEQTRFDDIQFLAQQILMQAEYRDLYNYFAYEIPFIPAWGETQAGNNYFMNKQNNLPADHILQYEAERNTHLLYNKLHPSTLMRPLTPYEDATAEIGIQEPMPDAPLVAPSWAPVGAFSYIRGQAPPGTYTRSYLPFAGADPSGSGGGGGQPAQLLQPPDPPQQWTLPCLPAPIKPPTPPAAWELTTGNVAPYDELKPKVLKEVDDFNRDSDKISQFFLKCELHFELFNHHFRYHPHKVIFCISRLSEDAEKWWEMSARLIGKSPTREQLYPTYEDFKTELRARFWKDADRQIKHAQWEKLRQVNFQDGDQFFQQFEELAYYANVCDNKQVMLTQIKKAAQETSKNTIYSADREVSTTYEGWKARLLHMDYNWWLKWAEAAGHTDPKPQAQKITMPQKGGQMSTSTLEKKIITGMTYGGCGMLMDIDAAKAVAKCFRCGKIRHFKRDCPNVPKSREEPMCWVNYYWDTHPTEKKTNLSMVEEVKESAEE